MARILIVEDDFDIAELLGAWLNEAGHQTIQAEDGLKALEVFEREAFDLVLLDLMLPKLDGFGVCEWMRKRSAVPIVMLTALDGEAEQLRGYDLRIDDYVAKPFSMPVLLRKIAAILRRCGGETGDRNVLRLSLIHIFRTAVNKLPDLSPANVGAQCVTNNLSIMCILSRLVITNAVHQ